MRKIYIYAIALLLSAGFSGCEKSEDFSLSTSEQDDAISSILENMVAVDGFYFSIGRYEVNQKQWLAVMGYNPSRVVGSSRPVESVTSQEVLSFIEKLNLLTGQNYRLPTLDEWNLAAYGDGSYSYGNSNNLAEVGWYSGNSDGTPHVCGEKSPNQYGLYDMFGNVAECVLYLSNNEYNDVRVSDDTLAVGGSWYSSAKYSEKGEVDSSDTNIEGGAVYRNPTLGFRLINTTVDAGDIGIVSSSDLAKIGKDVSYSLSGTYTLVKDIELSGEWTPIGTANSRFTGQFDGAGYKISGLTINSTEDNQGLFGYIYGATIKNVIINEPSITSTGSYIGSVVGYCYTVGLSSSVISGCSVIGGSITGGATVGGVVGYGGTATISACNNYSRVSGTSYVGGVCGNGSVTSCTNVGEISGDVDGSGYRIGGIIGLGSVYMSKNSGSVTAESGTYIGGIAGRGTSIGCYNTGNVMGYMYIAGVVGENSAGTVVGSYNIGMIIGTSYVGGVVGYAYNATTSGCYNVGLVKGDSNVENIIGSASGSASASYCYSIDQSGLYGSDTTVEGLNSRISNMNYSVSKAGYSYVAFSAGSPADTHLPQLRGENIEYSSLYDTSEEGSGSVDDFNYEVLF